MGCSPKIELERLCIQSPSVSHATVSDKKAVDGRTILVPPKYVLDVWYSRESSDGKCVLSKKHDRIVLGHLGTSLPHPGEWFTESGEFVESVFEQRLLTGLQRVLGE